MPFLFPLTMLADQVITTLNSFGINPANTPKPGGSYVSVNIRGGIAYVAIQFPILKGDYLYRGRLGQELTTIDGYEAARLCAANVLAQVSKHVGFEKVEGLNHLDFFYRAVEEWQDAAAVANGASDLFVSVLGESGIHTRSILGVDLLPKGFSVGLSGTFTLLK